MTDQQQGSAWEHAVALVQALDEKRNFWRGVRAVIKDKDAASVEEKNMRGYHVDAVRRELERLDGLIAAAEFAYGKTE